MENNQKIKWGIVGLGNIAQQFASELQLIHSAQIYAVASRNINKAQDFANEFQCSKAYGCYEELFQDDNVDIIPKSRNLLI